jgi:hypothetical protein
MLDILLATVLWRLGNIPEQSDTPEVQIELDIWNEIIKSY